MGRKEKKATKIQKKIKNAQKEKTKQKQEWDKLWTKSGELQDKMKEELSSVVDNNKKDTQKSPPKIAGENCEQEKLAGERCSRDVLRKQLDCFNEAWTRAWMQSRETQTIIREFIEMEQAQLEKTNK